MLREALHGGLSLTVFLIEITSHMMKPCNWLWHCGGVPVQLPYLLEGLWCESDVYIMLVPLTKLKGAVSHILCVTLNGPKKYLYCQNNGSVLLTISAQKLALGMFGCGWLGCKWIAT